MIYQVQRMGPHPLIERLEEPLVEFGAKMVGEKVGKIMRGFVGPQILRNEVKLMLNRGRDEALRFPDIAGTHWMDHLGACFKNDLIELSKVRVDDMASKVPDEAEIVGD